MVQLQSRSFVYVRNNKASLRCPICRAITSSNDVSFVVTKLKKPEGFDAGVSIKVVLCVTLRDLREVIFDSLRNFSSFVPISLSIKMPHSHSFVKSNSPKNLTTFFVIFDVVVLFYSKIPIPRYFFSLA